MFQHEDCRGFDILNHAIRMGSAEDEWRLSTAQTSSGSSQVSPAVVSPPMQSSNSFQFPWKLYDMLEQAEQDGLQDIVAWQGEGAGYGTSFKVFKPQVFVEKLMPRYFKQTKYKSFQRQLNLYGYTRINEGHGKGGYKHKYFLRGNKALCQYISRQSSEESSTQTSGASVSSSSNSSFHTPLATLSAHVAMVAPRNAPINHPDAVSANTSTNQFASKPSSSQVCDKDINEQYNALIQKDYQFPWKLHEMLEKAQRNDYEHVVSWQPPGNKCFRVHDPNLFVSTVMPLFFKQTKYKSFQRQLNLYGFARVDEGPHKGSYMHKLFQKDRRDLLSRMNRQKNSQCYSRSPITRSKRTGNCSAEKENSTQHMDVSEPISANSLPESRGSEVKCIDYGIPTILQSMSGDAEIRNEGLSPSGRSSDCQLEWRRTSPDGSSDWIIVVLHNDTFERESFHVHQHVLSCGERKSNYFAKLFESTSTPLENVLVLGTAEARIFSNILDYIYYDTKPKFDMRIAFSYFMMGKALDIDSLKQLVVDFYRNAMDGDNIQDFIQVVCDFEDNTLLESAIDYFAEERKSMDVALAGKLKPQMLRRILYHSNNQLERLGCDATTASRFVAESLHNHARFLSREQLLRMVDDEILTSIDAVAAIKLLAAYTIVCDGEQHKCADSSLRHHCVTTIARDWSRMRNEFEKSPALVKALKSFSSEVLFDILMKTSQ